MRFDQAHQQLFQSPAQGLNSAWARAAAEELRAEARVPEAEVPRGRRPLGLKALSTIVCVLLTTALVTAGAGTRPMEPAADPEPAASVTRD